MATDLRDALAEVDVLKGLYGEHRFDEYFIAAKQFLQAWGDSIRSAAHHRLPYFRTIRCLQALLVIHDIIATADDDMRQADEDLYLDAASRFQPLPHQRVKHQFEFQTRRSNIFKRRAFDAILHGNLDEASGLFPEAVAAAEEALVLASAAEREGSEATLQYLRFHSAITAMRWAEGQGLLEDAERALQKAADAAAHSSAPPTLLVGRGYILGCSDLDAYKHLIAARRAFRAGAFRSAVEEYSAWLTAVLEFRGHWRYRNVLIRKDLAQVFACLESRCPNCTACSASATGLELAISKWGIGRSARNLARVGSAIFHLRTNMDALQLKQILDNGVVPQLAFDASSVETIELAAADFSSQLPVYFTALGSELKGLRSMGCSDAQLRDVVWRRLRDFVEICAEYEEGRCADLPAAEVDNPPPTTITNVLDRLIRSRSARKSPNNFGTLTWARVKNQIESAELEGTLVTATSAWELAIGALAGYFPAIVRVVSREVKTIAGQLEHLTTVERLGGDEIEIRSQFRLDGDAAYLPPRYVRNPTVEPLRQNDRDKWVRATKAQAVFLLQTIPVWEGDWSQFDSESESQALDFKEAKPASVAKHLAAFSNAGGGWLIFGIYEPARRSAKGLARNLELAECAEIIDAVTEGGIRRVSPPVVPGAFFRSLPDGHLVLLCRIDESLTKPHRVKGVVYLRIGTMSTPVKDEEWNRLAGRV